MHIKVTREDLLKMVNSVSPSSMSECCKLTDEGKMVFTGHQHAERWDWTKKYLDSLSDERLYNLYLKHK